MKTLVLGLALAALASPLAAQTAKQITECEVQTNLIQSIVDMRAEGADKRALTSRVTRTLAGADATAKYREVVGPIVDWVYTLPEEQLTDEVGTGFKTLCLAQ